MRKLLARGAAALAVALMVAPQALGASAKPSGEFAPFAQCPLQIKTVSDCVHSVSEGGEFKIGSKSVPIEAPVTLQGGVEGSAAETKFYGAANGKTLSGSPQTVPGGLGEAKAPPTWPKALQEWFDRGIEKEGLTLVEASLELTGPSEGLTNVKLNTTNLLVESGTSLGLPVRIHLANALLGASCHIGSEAEPVELALTTGPSAALKGRVGKFKFNKENTLVTISDTKLVDGTYYAPAAEGCGGIFSYFVDPLVDEALGLPTKARSNVAILEGELQDANAAVMRKSG